MRAAVATLLLLVAALPAHAWTARLITATGLPLAGAVVSILGQTGEAITDSDGRFTWKPDPTPPFEILVVLRDGTYMKPLVIDRVLSGMQTLTVRPLLSEAVVVSGAAPGIESTPGAAATTIAGRDVQVRHPTNLMQTLENVAGVNQVSEGQAAVPALRGLARGRTLILMDGARVTSERRVGPSAIALDPSVIDAVDVARGPGSVAYGSDAFGGVIAVRTRRVAEAAPWQGQISGLLGAGVPEQRGSALVARGLPHGSVLVNVHARQADDWVSPAGPVFNSGFRDRGVLARVDQRVAGNLLTIGWQSDLGRDIERPRNNSRLVRFYYPWDDAHRLTTSYQLARLPGFTRGQVTAFWGHARQRTDQDRFATATTGRTIERADISATDYAVRAFGERLLGAARLEAGIDVNGRHGLHAVDDLLTYGLDGTLLSTRANVSVGSARRADTGLYASIESAVTSGLSLGAGVRTDLVTNATRDGYFGALTRRTTGQSGYIALTARVHRGLTTTLQFARGFRDPMLSDRFYRGPTGRGFITGNPDLSPESSLQADWTVRYTTRRWRALVAAYDYAIDDLVERYQTTTDTFFFRNRGRARIRGLEFESQVQLGRGVSLDLTSQLARGRAGETQAPLDDISPLTMTAVVRKAFGARGYAQVRTAMFAEDTRPGPTERAVPGYTLVDLHSGYSPWRPVEVRLQIRNLFDREYLASQDVRTTTAPGRQGSVTLALRF
jgi:outer membrane receptor protein involved in Fe transport